MGEPPSAPRHNRRAASPTIHEKSRCASTAASIRLVSAIATARRVGFIIGQTDTPLPTQPLTVAVPLLPLAKPAWKGGGPGGGACASHERSPTALRATPRTLPLPPPPAGRASWEGGGGRGGGPALLRSIRP